MLRLNIPVSYKKPTRMSMKLRLKIDTNINKIKDDNHRNVILHKTGIEWMDSPETSLYRSIDFLCSEDAFILIDELKEKDSICLFSCDESSAKRYNNLLKIYGFYSEII